MDERVVYGLVFWKARFEDQERQREKMVFVVSILTTEGVLMTMTAVFHSVEITKAGELWPFLLEALEKGEEIHLMEGAAQSEGDPCCKTRKKANPRTSSWECEGCIGL
jgi:hypothetical protein